MKKLKVKIITCMEDSDEARSLGTKLSKAESGDLVYLTKPEYEVLTKKTTYIDIGK